MPSTMFVWWSGLMISMMMVRVGSANDLTLRMALIMDTSTRHISLKDLEQGLAARNNDTTSAVSFAIDYFHGGVDQFVNDTRVVFPACPYSIILALTTCNKNVQLYRHIRTYCYGAILFSFFEFACRRPPPDIGFGIPNLRSIKDVVPLLYDVGFAFTDRSKKIVILYEDDLDLFAFHEFFYKSCRETLEYRLEAETETNRVLTKLNREIVESFDTETDPSPTFFVVIGRAVLMEKIMKTLKVPTLNSYRNKWAFIVTDELANVESLDDEIRDALSISDVYIIHHKPNKECILSKLNCFMEPNIIDLIERSVENLQNDQTNNYTFYGAANRKLQTKNRLLSEIKINFDSDDYCGDCSTYVVESLFKHRTNDLVDEKKGIVQINHPNVEYEIQTQKHGVWNVFKGFQMQGRYAPPIDLKNRPIKIGIVNQPPYVQVLSVNGTSQVTGTNYEMILVIAAKMNFTPEFIFFENFMSQTMNGTGFIHRVANGDVEIGANGYWKTPERLKLVEFTTPYDMNEIRILTQKTDEDHRYLFLAPFTWDAWICLLITVILMGPLLWVVHHSSRYYDYYQLNNGRGLFKLGNCIWYCFGAMVQQGGDYLPLAVSGRILISFWWLFVIVTVTTYSGNLVALLTFPKIFNPINGLDDLIAHKSTIRFGSFRARGLEEIIENSYDEQIKQLEANMDYYEESEKALVFDLVAANKLAVLGSHSEIRYLISDDFKTQLEKKNPQPCRLEMAREPIIALPVSFVITKGQDEHFVGRLNHEMGRMAKSGLVTLWNRKFDVPGNDCLFPLIMRGGEVKKISMSHMMDCFFVLACGLSLGIVILGIETLKQWREKNQSPKDMERKETEKIPNSAGAASVAAAAWKSSAAMKSTEPIQFHEKLFSVNRYGKLWKRVRNGFVHGFYGGDKSPSMDTATINGRANQHQNAGTKSENPLTPAAGTGNVYFTYDTTYYDRDNMATDYTRLPTDFGNGVGGAGAGPPSTYKKEWNKAFLRQQKLYYFQKNLKLQQQQQNKQQPGKNMAATYLRKHY